MNYNFPMFYFDEINGKKILKSDLIKNANAFFTTRDICICDKLAPLPREGADTEEMAIEKNKKIISDYLNIELKNMISPIQTHSANVDIATENKFYYPDTDGLILEKTNLAIFLNFADCTPLIFYDEKQNIGAISHAGWRGTAQKIALITANKLINEFNSKPKDYHNMQISNPDKKFHIDLKEINRKQLADIGIEKIDICPYCTCCDNEYFFSFRKENGTTLRHSAVLKLNKNLAQTY